MTNPLIDDEHLAEKLIQDHAAARKPGLQGLCQECRCTWPCWSYRAAKLLQDRERQDAEEFNEECEQLAALEDQLAQMDSQITVARVLLEKAIDPDTKIIDAKAIIENAITCLKKLEELSD